MNVSDDGGVGINTCTQMRRTTGSVSRGVAMFLLCSRTRARVGGGRGGCTNDNCRAPLLLLTPKPKARGD